MKLSWTPLPKKASLLTRIDRASSYCAHSASSSASQVRALVLRWAKPNCWRNYVKQVAHGLSQDHRERWQRKRSWMLPGKPRRDFVFCKIAHDSPISYEILV